MPPEPDCKVLEDAHFLVADDLEVAPRSSEDVVLDFSEEALELTEHQRAMLKPADERIKELVFPKSIADRARVKRKNRHKNRWSSKLSTFCTGKISRKWRERLRRDKRDVLMVEATGKANTKTRLSEEKPKKSKVPEKKASPKHEKTLARWNRTRT